MFQADVPRPAAVILLCVARLESSLCLVVSDVSAAELSLNKGFEIQFLKGFQRLCVILGS